MFSLFKTKLTKYSLLNEAKPNTIELKNKIKKYQSFDQYIAKKNNTVQAYEKQPRKMFSLFKTKLTKYSLNLFEINCHNR
jgi:predicted patatin/cPLA2 family phospholipase